MSTFAASSCRAGAASTHALQIGSPGWKPRVESRPHPFRRHLPTPDANATGRPRRHGTATERRPECALRALGAPTSRVFYPRWVETRQASFSPFLAPLRARPPVPPAHRRGEAGQTRALRGRPQVLGMSLPHRAGASIMDRCRDADARQRPAYRCRRAAGPSPNAPLSGRPFRASRGGRPLGACSGPACRAEQGAE